MTTGDLLDRKIQAVNENLPLKAGRTNVSDMVSTTYPNHSLTWLGSREELLGPKDFTSNQKTPVKENLWFLNRRTKGRVSGEPVYITAKTQT